MELKTKISAEDGKQDLVITREFEIPLELLFTAFIEPEIVEQWMGTKVLKLESARHGSYQFETTDPMGNKHRFNGTILSMSLIIKSLELLKWKTLHTRFNLNF